LIRYLLDELAIVENGFSDALCPIPNEVNRSFLGEHRHQRLATIGDVEGYTNTLEDRVATRVLGVVRQEVKEALSELQLGQATIPHPFSPSPTPSNHVPDPVRQMGSSSVNRLQWRLVPPPLTANRVSECGQIPVGQLPPELVIPRAPAEMEKGECWKYFVDCWTKGDPARGLNTPLRDWDESWYSGKNRSKHGMNYHNRKRVALEFLEG
jgi:hypothetical protein